MFLTVSNKTNNGSMKKIIEEIENYVRRLKKLGLMKIADLSYKRTPASTGCLKITEGQS